MEKGATQLAGLRQPGPLCGHRGPVGAMKGKMSIPLLPVLAGIAVILVLIVAGATIGGRGLRMAAVHRAATHRRGNTTQDPGGDGSGAPGRFHQQGG